MNSNYKFEPYKYTAVLTFENLDNFSPHFPQSKNLTPRGWVWHSDDVMKFGTVLLVVPERACWYPHVQAGNTKTACISEAVLSDGR